MLDQNISYSLLGCCGAGKSTVARFFIDEGWKPIFVSDLLRAQMQNEGEYGALIKQCAESGGIIPDDVVFKVAAEVLEANVGSPFVMESFPVNVAQLGHLEGLLDHTDSKVHFIYLQVSRDTVLKRLIGRRTCDSCYQVYNIYYKAPKKEGCCDQCSGRLFVRRQDNAEVIDKRLEIFDRWNTDLLAAIKKKGFPLITIDGNRFWTAEQFREELARQERAIGKQQSGCGA